MSKKVLSLVLALVMVLGTFGTAFAAAATTPTGNEKVDKLIELGLVKGYADGTYGLAQAITRAEMATMVVRALDLEAVANASAAFPSQFTDMNSANVLWARGFVNVAAGQGIVNGYPEGNFLPANNVTYAEASAMLVRVLGGLTAAEEANAVWPTTYLAKAAQLGIFADVDGIVDYNAPATRENLFEMVFNTLMAGTDLLIANTVEGIVVENYRTEALAKDEVVVHVMKDQDARDDKYDFEEGEEFKVVVTPELAEKGIDVETLLGKVVKVSYDKAGKVVGVAINNNYDYLEGKLTDITTRDLELEDKEYTVVKSESVKADDDRLYQVYENNKDIAYDKLKAEYANITVRNGKVLFIDAYNFDDVAPVAKDIDSKDRVAYYDDNQDGEVRTLTVDEDAYVINFVDGEMKLGDYKDISANDVIHWFESAKEQLTVIVRPSEDNKVEGEFEKASASRAKDDSSIKITVDGEEYPADIKEEKRDPVYSTLISGQDFLTLTEDYKAELEDFEDTDVILLRDMFGKVQLIGSETEDGTFYAMVLQVLNNEFRLLRADNTKEYYTTNIRDTEFLTYNDETGLTEEARKSEFEVGSLVKVTAKGEVLTKVTLLTEEEDKYGYKVEEITKNLIKFFELDEPDYMGKSTVVFVENGSKSKAMTLAEFLKNYKYPNADDSDDRADLYAYIELSEADRRTGTKTVEVIVVTNPEEKDGSFDKEIVKIDRVYFAGSTKMELRVKSSGLDGETKTYAVTDKDARDLINNNVANKFEKGAIVEISLTKTDTPEIKDIKSVIAAKNVETFKVTNRSGNAIELDGTPYRLSVDADIFGEILKGKFIAVEKSGTIITVADVRDEYEVEVPEERTGKLTDGTLDYFVLDDTTVYFFKDTTILKDANGNVLYVGKPAEGTTYPLAVGEYVTIEGDVITKQLAE